MDDDPGGAVGDPGVVQVLLQDRRGRGPDRPGGGEPVDPVLVEHGGQRDVQADEDRRQRGGEHGLGGLGVGPHVELRRGGDVAATGRRSAHDDQPADARSRLGEDAQQQGDVGERADGGDRDRLGEVSSSSASATTAGRGSTTAADGGSSTPPRPAAPCT